MAQAAQGEQQEDKQFFSGIMRGFGGALLFSLPILLTMEMWWLGFYMYRWRLILMLLLMIPTLIYMAHFTGIRSGTGWKQDIVDGITAYGIGFVTAVVTLSLLGIITPEMPLREIVGKIMIQAPTSAFGAVLARSEFGGGGKNKEKERKQKSGYWAEMFFVAVGAFYLAATVAATQEMLLVAFKMTAWHAIALILFEIALMHAILYGMKFSGAPEVPKGTPWWSIFIRFTLPGYVVALLVCAYVLWTFDRFEGVNPHWILMFTLVLGLPGSVGGAAGRLII